MKKTVCHKDGTVSYWSVYEQVWKDHAETVSDLELAAMGSLERDTVMCHLRMPGAVARIVDRTDGYGWSDDSLDYIDETGEAYPTKAAARRAAHEEGFIRVI